MQPQLILQDFKGLHNARGSVTQARLLREGGWKRQRLVVVIPADGRAEEQDGRIVVHGIAPKVAFAIWNLVFPPNQAVARILAVGCEVGEAYTQALEQVMAHPELSQWEYMLTIEHDNMPPPDGLTKLMTRMEAHKELACIGGLYFTKGEGGVPQIWGDPKDPVLNFRPQVPRAGELQECCGTGMGFNLWRLKMFKDARLRRPWFKTIAGREGVGTQDLYFWSDARKYGYRCAIDNDVQVGHYDAATDTVW